MTALETLKSRYDAGEPLTDLETLVLTFGGETEAAELQTLVKALKKIAKMRYYKLKQGETVNEAYYHCHHAAQKALDKVNRGGVK